MRTVKIVLASCMAIVCGMTIANERNNEIRKSPEYRAALARGALASLRIQIVDDENNVVPYARVKVSFDMTTHQIAKIQDADASGLCFVEGLTRGNSVVIVVEKDGYYSSKREQCLVGTAHAHGVKNGRWMPSPIDEKITLRKIRHPVDIVRERRIVDMPATNVWVGFDMRVSDFVKPNGGGAVADFECFVEWDGKPSLTSKYCTLKIRFAQPLSGGCYSHNCNDSDFPFPYRAHMIEPLIRDVSIIDRDGDPHTTSVRFREDSSLVTRTRCETDACGNITSAHYGCIRNLEIGPSRRGKALLVMSWVFNPTPNDTNLEDADTVRRMTKQREK